MNPYREEGCKQCSSFQNLKSSYLELNNKFLTLEKENDILSSKLGYQKQFKTLDDEKSRNSIILIIVTICTIFISLSIIWSDNIRYCIGTLVPVFSSITYYNLIKKQFYM